MTALLVAIDGPAGSGKSSVAREVAGRLSFGMLDTGSAYRALTWAALERGVSLDDERELLDLFAQWQQSASVALAGPAEVRAFGVDVTRQVREPRVTGAVSSVSRHRLIRQNMNAVFRQWLAETELAGVVIEGRDITSVVVPHAPVRIILTASPEVRAARRAAELPELSPREVRDDLDARDAKDSQVVNFMSPTPGVELIDTTELDFEGAVAAVIAQVRAAETEQNRR